MSTSAEDEEEDEEEEEEEEEKLYRQPKGKYHFAHNHSAVRQNAALRKAAWLFSVASSPHHAAWRHYAVRHR